MPLLFLDAETYFDRKEGYDLRSMCLTDYIMDPRFQPHGVGVQIDDGRPEWIPAPTIHSFLNTIDWSNTSVIAHNVKFDGSILAWKYNVNPASWIDTKMMAKAVWGSTQSSFSLESCGARLGLAPKGQLKCDGMKELDSHTEAELAEYCLRDVEICAGLYDRLKKDIPTSQWQIMDWTARCFIEPKLVVDRPLAEKVAADLEKAQAEIIEKSGYDRETFASNVKFADLLKGKGYDVPMKPSPRIAGKMIPALSISDTGFIEMREQAGGELKTLCDARIAAKQTMEKKRAEKLASVGRYGLYPWDIEFSGAKQTHRFSGGNGAGGNPQNFPRESELRNAIKAPEGQSLIVADFANIELRVLAYLTQEPKLIAGIEKGLDTYCDFGTRKLGRVVTKKDRALRHHFKGAVLGLGYGMGPEKYLRTVKALQAPDDFTPEQTKELEELVSTFTLDMAIETVQFYRSYYEAVPAFWKRCDELLNAVSTGFKLQVGPVTTGKDRIILPSGLDLKYPGLKRIPRENGRGFEWLYQSHKRGKEAENVKIYGGKITENLCQALAGEICKEAIKRLIDISLPPVGQVHDELHVLCPSELDIPTMELVYKAMTDPMPWWPELKLDASVGVGPSWGEAKA